MGDIPLSHLTTCPVGWYSYSTFRPRCQSPGGNFFCRLFRLLHPECQSFDIAVHRGIRREAIASDLYSERGIDRQTGVCLQRFRIGAQLT